MVGIVELFVVLGDMILIGDVFEDLHYVGASVAVVRKQSGCWKYNAVYWPIPVVVDFSFNQIHN